ncbi:DUF2141 domain-containing protein [Asticcacaulis excentricus]|uniref:DUF2141 domain-containing protein n=1 Tax=Asticcacaulis excentricus (strain ATCC 15261 / DSM 4724 / KCTC 12464 / NCIMB 9791 / VKM B-1370 / CB 48) TaxID=573065 RepID=E8RL82_ASTEC|nr:DUF2141 domain-containing protein [Asticcacaulis excentricus]ADU12572.1 Protein of unknown function DUF2141 [Asticcacaulis excentricus CB 48]
MFKPALIAALVGLVAQPVNAETLTVHFSKLTPKGTLMVALYKGEEAYKGGKPAAAQQVTVSADTATATFDVEPGQYGLKMFHDVNGNGKMDTNPFGMPVEPFAFSNNAKGRMGPATWADAVFEVKGDTTQDIAF